MLRTLLPLSALLLLAACAGIETAQDYDPQADLTGDKSYRWQAAADSGNSLMDERIRTAVEAGLATLGYRLQIEGATDFLVSYQYLLSSTAGESHNPKVGIGLGGGSRGGFGTAGISFGLGGSERARETLILDLRAADNQRLLWRGSGQQAAPTSSTPDETTARMSALVKAVLKDFPGRR